MSDNVPSIEISSINQVDVAIADQRSRVLRNTCWLLAFCLLSALPGAIFAVGARLANSLPGMLGLIVFLAGAYCFDFAIVKTRNSVSRVPLLFGLTFFIGMMLSRVVTMVLGYRTGPASVIAAIVGTVAVLMTMAALSSVLRRDLSLVGQRVVVVTVGIVVGGLTCLILSATRGAMILSVVAIYFLCAYILRSLRRIVDSGESNPVSVALVFYLAVKNILKNVLHRSFSFSGGATSFICTLIGMVVGLLVVRGFMLDSAEEIGWRIFWQAFANGNIGASEVGHIADSATFAKVVIGSLLWA